jgi:hypothetical protein
MKRCLLLLAALALSTTGLYAHVGSPDIALEGMAGPYHLLVSIKPPDVIPGTATVTVFIQNGEGTNVYTQPIYFYSGRNGAPSADRLQPVAGQPGQYKGIVWMMTDGSSSILLSVTGSLGKGELVVPVIAMSTAQKKFPVVTGYSLAILGILLFVLMVTIIGASVGEGITGQGEALSPRRRRGKRIAFAVTALLSSLLVYGGNVWWQSSEEKYRKFMFKPMHASYDITPQSDSSNQLKLVIDARHVRRESSLSYLVPDHGKLIHLYLMRMPAMDVIAHLHPLRMDSATFKTNLPPLPQGKYLAFADIVYNTGFAETLKDEFTIDHDLGDSSHKMDPDDAYAFVQPMNSKGNAARANRNSIVCGKPGTDGKAGTGVKMKDGSAMVMEDAPDGYFESGALVALHFAVYDENNQPALLTPYMGMMGHAAIVRDDGTVFVHIHPVGTYSMAAQENMLGRMGENTGRYQVPDKTAFRDSIDRVVTALRQMPEPERNAILMKQMNMPGADSTGVPGMSGMPGMGIAGMNRKPGMKGGAAANNEISFPYTFPRPGIYRIWVQVKRNGQILTAAFDRNVR